MRRISFVFIVLGILSFYADSPRAQRGVAGHSFVLDDGSGNTLTILYPNIPPVLGNSIFNFLPGGGSSIPGGSANGQTLWWNSTTLLWTADNSLTNTGSAVGIGTPTPNWPLDLQHTFTQTTNPEYGSSALIQIQPSAVSGARYVGISSVSDAENANTIVGQVEGVRGQASLGEYSSSSAPVELIAGTVGSAENYSTQLLGEADGAWGQVVNYSTATIDAANAIKAALFNESTGTLTNACGVNVLDANNTGTITNLYGIYVSDQTAGANNWSIFLSDGTPTGSLFDVASSGNVGIGTSTPNYPLDLEQTLTQTSNSIYYGSNAQILIQPSGVSSARYVATSGVADAENANSIFGVVEGVRGQASAGDYGPSTQSLSIMSGVVGSGENNTTQIIPEADGTWGQIVNYSTGTITAANALKAALFNEGAGTLTNACGLNVLDAYNTGTITNLYGIYVSAQTAGANNWPIFLSDGTATGSLFAVQSSGNVGIGTGSSAPTANLQVVGTVSIGSSSDASVTKISNIAQYNVILTFPATAAQTANSIQVSLPATGAPALTDGVDDVILEIPNAVQTAVTGVFTAWVKDATDIVIQFNNYSSSTQTPPPGARYYFTVITH